MSFLQFSDCFWIEQAVLAKITPSILFWRKPLNFLSKLLRKEDLNTPCWIWKESFDLKKSPGQFSSPRAGLSGQDWTLGSRKVRRILSFSFYLVFTSSKALSVAANLRIANHYICLSCWLTIIFVTPFHFFYMWWTIGDLVERFRARLRSSIPRSSLVKFERLLINSCSTKVLI